MKFPLLQVLAMMNVVLASPMPQVPDQTTDPAVLIDQSTQCGWVSTCYEYDANRLYASFLNKPPAEVAPVLPGFWAKLDSLGGCTLYGRASDSVEYTNSYP